MAQPKKLVLFASGKGSNVQAIIDYFKKDNLVEIHKLVVNKDNAGVLEIAKTENIPVILITSRKAFLQENWYQEFIDENVDLIVLAGFLWPIPANLIQLMPNKIINIHPALLPNYGGKGMYGMNVHQAVVNSTDTRSGITIHFVTEEYDDGPILLQATCNVPENRDPNELAQKIHVLEHFYFPRTIDFLLKKEVTNQQ